MKTSYNILFAALAAVVVSSCAQLDTEPTGSTITAKQKEEVVADNPAMAQASVNSISAMFNRFGNGDPGEEDHNDFGYASIMMFLDCRGRDLVSPNIGYNWFRHCLSMVNDRITSSYINMIIWNTLYNQIYSCNLVAGSISPDTDNPTLQYYLGQALAVRAFDYFTLAQAYQLTYKGNESKPCVPIILDTNADEAAANGVARSTVAETYEQIMKDLDLAVKCLESTNVVREDKRYVSAAVAHGIRARVNLVMNNWDAAAADAQYAIDSNEASPIGLEAAAKPGFKEITEPDWLWGIVNAETDDLVETGICNFPSHMGSLSYGYASVGVWRSINKSLYNAIPDTDVRKGWFLDANKTSANLTPEQQAYVTSKGCVPYTQVKFAPYKDVLGTATNANDIPLMRVEEMYLILAEAQANGAAGDAATTLTDFVSTYRDPAYSVSGDIKDAIEFQRRVELWGEGLTYLDVLRYNKGLDRRGAGFDAEFVFNLDKNSPLLIYQIPNIEIQANPLINEEDNNENGGTPTPVDDII